MTTSNRKSFLDDDLDSDFGEVSAFDDIEIDIESDPQEQGKKRSLKTFDIDLNRIQAKRQVREDFDPVELEELATTIKNQGLTNPITVKWSAEDNQWLIIAGERRYRAVELLGWDAITCTVKDENLSDIEFLEIQISENTHRKTLNAIEEARGYKQMMEAHGLNGKQVAARFGIGTEKVNRAVRLLILPEDIQVQISSGELSKTLLREVQKLKSEEEQRKLIEDYKQNGSLSAITKKVQQKKGKKPAAAKKSKTATINGIKLTAAGKNPTKADIAAALRVWVEELESDGRGKRAA